MSDYTIKINEVSIDHGSSFINNGHMGCSAAAEEETMLLELQKIREQLSKTEPMVAEAVAKLETAVRAQDKPAASTVVRQLSTGFAASLFSNLASAGLLAFLGMR